VRSHGASQSQSEDCIPLNEPRRHRSPSDGLWHVAITQGSTYVSKDPEEVITTILGSCVAACLRDPVAGVGGMNHFLLPEGRGADRLEVRYGANAMELLINGILQRGGMRQRLEAKIFGGANVIAGLSDIGAANASFAQKYLTDERIPITGGDLGGKLPRRVQFAPVSGRARQMTIAADPQRLYETEINKIRQSSVTDTQRGNDVELF
jgi:chemotaxis protein CheD